MSSTKGRLTTIVLAIVVIMALIAVPVVFLFGRTGGESELDAGGGEGGSVVKLFDSAAPMGPDTGVFDDYAMGSQVSFYRLSDGHRTGTATERFARPALSLSKLYIADYVLERGSLAEQYEAIEMISSSDDRSADDLYEKYPTSITAVARKYGLTSTRADEQWGYSVTSTYDVVSFIAQLMQKNPTHPILVAMAEASPVAADGYGQDFGTSTLPGVIGTKWGWSDAGDLHSSVSFGENFIVAAAVTGTSNDLTDLVEFQLSDEINEAARVR
ncbi:hypothetical protein [Corynebacterium atrinae]|uniref:hypothetical protein n=1 Tax=Corynebacterium atrinae TaxID=1336740 RepID=UPI0025B4AF04|nr:hypothetical protein [Corynebacterium atrinae]